MATNHTPSKCGIFIAQNNRMFLSNKDNKDLLNKHNFNEIFSKAQIEDETHPEQSI